MCTDSKILFDVLIYITSRNEKRLLIDLKGLRETEDSQDVEKLVWIGSEKTTAHGLTEKGKCGALE